MAMRVTVISSTHGRHDELDLPPGDLLIHCGDIFNLLDTAPDRIAALDDWFGRQKFARILYTGATTTLCCRPRLHDARSHCATRSSSATRSSHSAGSGSTARPGCPICG